MNKDHRTATNNAIFLAAIVILSLSCHEDNPLSGGKQPCSSTETGIVPHPPYDSPIWHPGGQLIGFNHTPLVSITYPNGVNCPGEQHFDGDSAGFWLINADGTNMRRILPYTLHNPAWSSDGKWIAFGSRGEIFKMKFAGGEFDTTSIAQLTSGGSYFLPAWSSDGKWIAYNESTCDGPNTCGIWFMSSSGSQQTFLADYGNYPNWNPTSLKLIFCTVAVAHDGATIGDSLWTCDVNTRIKSFLAFVGGSNTKSRYLQYSPNGSRIAFCASSNLWIMDSTAVSFQQLTTEGVDGDFGTAFSWSPSNDKIIYTRYRSTDWTMENGVLWMIDTNSKMKTQFTMNP
jgi:Tol biopolymer transport system component